MDAPQALLELTVGTDNYERRLQRVEVLRKSIVEVCRVGHDG